MSGVRVVDLGRLAYEPAYRIQCEHVREVVSARDAGTPDPGRILLVEHDPVITIGRHPGSTRNLVASHEALARQGVSLVESDRGGDITYHGPGQVVAYLVLDLNLLGLGLHAYMRLLESAVIAAVARFGVKGRRDESATGVWAGPGPAKLCAMGVRVRRWVSMHGLALNVTTDLSRFGLIVPCGLPGRPVTSLRELLGDASPPMPAVKAALAEELRAHVERARVDARLRRAAAAASPDGTLIPASGPPSPAS